MSMTIKELNQLTTKMVKEGHGEGLVMARTERGLFQATPETFLLDTSGVTNVKPLLVVNTGKSEQ